MEEVDKRHASGDGSYSNLAASQGSDSSISQPHVVREFQEIPVALLKRVSP